LRRGLSQAGAEGRRDAGRRPRVNPRASDQRTTDAKGALLIAGTLIVLAIVFWKLSERSLRAEIT
jgi:hypothetical protein